MVKCKLADTETELRQILALQGKNHFSNLTIAEQQEQGFVTLQHTLPLLKQMQSYEKQIIAVADDKVVGYALTMVRQLKQSITLLDPLFTLMDTLKYQGKILSTYNSYVMGQICIDHEYRKRGILRMLYDMHRKCYNSRYELCITEVSNHNKRSLGAHLHYGFEIVHSYKDETGDWAVIVLDLR